MMDARLKRIKELFSESEKRNGELAHENFELKKRIAELEEIGIVHCSECIYYTTGKQTFEELANSEKRNGELSHDNFKLKKRIAELEEIDIVRCEICKYWSFEKEVTRFNGREQYAIGYCCLEDKYSDYGFCSDGERKGAK